MTTVPVEAARRLLLRGQALTDDPASVHDPYALIERLGFVQIDTINVVERAQHLTLNTRMDAYRPPMLRHLLEQDRLLFEHWTHDASLIPIAYFRYWRHKFARYARHTGRTAWWRSALGDEPDRVIAHVEGRVREEGALRSQDFEHPEARSGTWWAWKPQKSALEYLWRRGTLAVAGRRGFQKVYDLTERVFPQAVAQPEASREETVDWACAGALERLGVATPSELTAYWNLIDGDEARAWCERAAADGRAVPVRVEDVDGNARPAFARPDWEAFATEPLSGARLLCPFDPVVRDRKRLARLFGFEYRFEAFVPPPDRVFGYYVMPVLEGDRFIGRVDLKQHRAERALEIRGLWPERGVRRKRAVLGAVERLAAFLGTTVRGPG